MKTKNTVFIGLLIILSSLMCLSQAQADSTNKNAQLEQILAPVALYPDTVLSHILIASTYPLEVVQADRWLRRNPSLIGQKAVNAADNQGWDPSVAALVAFPDLLRRMGEDLQWTQNLGDFFLADESAVMVAVQHLRERAFASGNLNQADHIKVVRENKIIYIEPAIERAVYLPYYDSRVVFGLWWWASHPPIFWLPPSRLSFANHFYWGHRVNLGLGFYSRSIRWRDRRVLVHRNNFRPKRYTNRHLARHNQAKRWKHRPIHRRNVSYTAPRVQKRYARNSNTAKAQLNRRNARSNPNTEFKRRDKNYRSKERLQTERKIRRENRRLNTNEETRQANQARRAERRAQGSRKNSGLARSETQNIQATQTNRKFRANRQTPELKKRREAVNSSVNRTQRSRSANTEVAKQPAKRAQRRSNNTPDRKYRNAAERRERKARQSAPSRPKREARLRRNHREK